MSLNKGETVHARAAWNSITARHEKKCAICGAAFMATPVHRYRIGERWMCSYNCFRRAQNYSYPPMPSEKLKQEREECLEQIVEKTHWMIAAQTPKERRNAADARNKWLGKLEEVERCGGEAADEAGEQA